MFRILIRTSENFERVIRELSDRVWLYPRPAGNYGLANQTKAQDDDSGDQKEGTE